MRRSWIGHMARLYKAVANSISRWTHRLMTSCCIYRRSLSPRWVFDINHVLFLDCAHVLGRSRTSHQEEVITSSSSKYTIWLWKEIRDGANVKDIYAEGATSTLVRTKKPELEKHFFEERRRRHQYWDERCYPDSECQELSRTLKDGMTLCVTTGFNDIENPNPQDKKSKVYSMVLSDTVRVSPSEPIVFTGCSFWFGCNLVLLQGWGWTRANSEEGQERLSDRKSVLWQRKNITKTKLRARAEIPTLMRVRRQSDVSTSKRACCKEARGRSGTLRRKAYWRSERSSSKEVQAFRVIQTRQSVSASSPGFSYRHGSEELDRGSPDHGSTSSVSYPNHQERE